MSAPLSVLHFSTADNIGGSARSAYRIHDGLRARGHVSRMLVGMRGTRDPDVDTVWSGRAGQRANQAADWATGRLGLQYRFVPSTARVLAHPWLAQTKLIQLYNTHGGYFATRMLPALSARAPIVWRLSDMWAFTGHCAHSGDCENWRTGCLRCPDLAAYPEIGIDTTAHLWRMKEELYRQCRITVVAPSSWSERLARQSPLLGHFPVHRIPNGVDLTAFRPGDRSAARASLGLDPASTVILFSAATLDSNEHKGTDDAIEALRRLGPRDNVVVLLAGRGGESWIGRVPFTVRPLGYLGDEQRLAQAYVSADLLLAPSRAETLPNAALEALACGVPTVACDAGGMRDAVRHLETGWLAARGDIAGVAEGLRRLLENPALRLRLGAEARRHAEKEFARETEIARFEALYQALSTEPAPAAAGA